MNIGFTPKPGRLMDQVKETLRFYHYSYSTEKSDVHWILRYIRFNDRHHPKDMGNPVVNVFQVIWPSITMSLLRRNIRC